MFSILMWIVILLAGIFLAALLFVSLAAILSLTESDRRSRARRRRRALN